MRNVPLALVALLAAVPALGVVPETISYQTVLTDADGMIVPDDDYVVNFRIYDAPSGGTALWTETQTVTVSGGVLEASLGSVTTFASAALAFDAPYFLSLEVNGGAGELAPRVPLESLPYALNTDRVGGALVDLSGAGEGLLRFDGSQIVLGQGAGVASASATNGTTCLNSTTPFSTLARTITAPSDGFVLAIATVHVTAFRNDGSTAEFGISPDPNAFFSSADTYKFNVTEATPIVHEMTFTVHGLFPVTAGDNELHLIARAVNIASQGNFCFFARRMTLVFVPEAFGDIDGSPRITARGVSPTRPATGSLPHERGAVPDGYAGAHDEIVLRELAVMRARIAELEAELAIDPR